MTTDRLRRRLDQIERSHPAGGWRRWCGQDITDWPDHALMDLMMERLPTWIGVAVPPDLAKAALSHVDFLQLLIGHDSAGARRFLRDLVRQNPPQRT